MEPTEAEVRKRLCKSRELQTVVLSKFCHHRLHRNKTREAAFIGELKKMLKEAKRRSEKLKKARAARKTSATDDKVGLADQSTDVSLVDSIAEEEPNNNSTEENEVENEASGSSQSNHSEQVLESHKDMTSEMPDDIKKSDDRDATEATKEKVITEQADVLEKPEAGEFLSQNEVVDEQKTAKMTSRPASSEATEVVVNGTVPNGDIEKAEATEEVNETANSDHQMKVEHADATETLVPSKCELLDKASEKSEVEKAAREDRLFTTNGDGEAQDKQEMDDKTTKEEATPTTVSPEMDEVCEAKAEKVAFNQTVAMVPPVSNI